MIRGREVYDNVINVLKTYEAELDHDVEHGEVLWQDHYQIVITPGNFTDGVAETLIKHQRFKLGERDGDVVVYRIIK